MARIPIRLFLALALAVAVGLAVFASPYASSSPDGLQKVAETKGFTKEQSPTPHYALPGIHDASLATALAGFTGTLLVALAGVAAVRLVRRRTP